MTLIGRIRNVRLSSQIQRRARVYEQALTDEERLELQLRRFNVEWKRILKGSSFFRDRAGKHRLPALFSSWAEFMAAMPVTERDTLQRFAAAMASAERRPDLVRQTGGSNPLRIPAWRSEMDHGHIDTWCARGWYGITPGSPLFLLWGHSHLLGTGIRGWLNARKRVLFDALLGYHRCSAYRLQPAELRKAGQALVRHRPEYLYGYSAALDLFARANEDRADLFRGLGLKAIIGTSEVFPAPDSAKRLEALGACPVAMEYGSGEAGVVAHTVPGGTYRVLWDSYFVEARKEHPTSRGYSIFLTSLYPRCVPLVRYKIGDEIALEEGMGEVVEGLASFKRVIGRSSDYVRMGDGTLIHSEYFSNAISECDGIVAFQVVHGESPVVIRYVAPRKLGAGEVQSLRSELSKIHPDLDGTGFTRVEELAQTRAGKIRTVVRSDGWRTWT